MNKPHTPQVAASPAILDWGRTNTAATRWMQECVARHARRDPTTTYHPTSAEQVESRWTIPPALDNADHDTIVITDVDPDTVLVRFAGDAKRYTVASRS